MKLRKLGVRLLQSLGLVLVAYLFVCLMTASVRQSAFAFELPGLIEPDSNSGRELLLFCVPGQLLFVLLGCFFRRPGLLIGAYLLAATTTALLQCQLFAEAFGSTWSNAEIFGLLAVNLPSLLLALAPGLALLWGLERISRVRRSHSCG